MITIFENYIDIEYIKSVDFLINESESINKYKEYLKMIEMTNKYNL